MDLIPPPPAELEAMSNEQLIVFLREQLALTAERILNMAWAIGLLEQRNYPLNELKLGLLNDLRRIFNRQTLPGLLVRFATNYNALRATRSLPLPDQHHLANGGTVLLLLRSPEGFTHLQMDPARMSMSQLRLVFTAEGIRSESEQRAILEDRQERAESAVVPVGHAEESVSLTLPFSRAEYNRLNRTARTQGKSLSQIIMEALAQANLL